MEQNKKTMRHFYCRDVLWTSFEQMATDFDCSIDYLINEAMRGYARAKNYPSPSTGSSGSDIPQQPAGKPMVTPAGVAAAAASVSQSPSRPPPPPPPTASARPAAMPPPIQVPSTPPGGMIQRSTQPRPVARPVSSPNLAEGLPGGQTLYLAFNGQRFTIDKDQFIIGRGSKTSDLPIKDGNISRKHAAVIRRNGVYYIKDLGSTNGIDYKGMRIDNKRIDEGDVFHICDYELRFSYLG